MSESSESEVARLRVRHFEPVDVVSRSLDEPLAAVNRKYAWDADLPWRERIVDVAAMPQIDYYDHCFSYFAGKGAPLVPLSETRKVINIIRKCRESAESTSFGCAAIDSA